MYGADWVTLRADQTVYSSSFGDRRPGILAVGQEPLAKGVLKILFGQELQS